jgi:integrase/recombinase XerD
MNTLGQAVQEYLTVRRDLGFKLQAAGKGLLDFVRFMEQHHAPYVTHILALEWAQQATTAQARAQRLSFVRGFARYRSATDPRTQIPPAALLPYRPKRSRPYLYSDEEISRLLSAALTLSKGAGLRPWTYYCLFGLLSVSGLRISEATNLTLDDVDLNTAVLTVRGAKGGQSRLVPLHSSTRHVLADYLARREQVWAKRPVSSYVFVSNRGHRLDGAEIRRTFYALSRQIGLRGPHDNHGPRLHDFRHRFATQTLLQWYRAGDDAERRLPILSAYLGHVHVCDTFWYLSHQPELMQEAMGRLERHWEEQP